MEIDYDEVKRVVENAEFKPWEEFSCAGLNYLLFPCEYSEGERDRRSPAVFFTSSSVADWDIYFAMEEVDERFRRTALLHEVVESGVFNSGASGESYEDACARSHEVAVAYDDRYARESLSSKDYGDYCRFVEKVRSDA
jgi:hypothetical protein